MLEIKRECFICKGTPDHFIPFSQYMRMEGGIRYRGLYLCENHKDYYKDKILIYTPNCVLAESVKRDNIINMRGEKKKLSNKERNALDLLKRAGILEETRRDTAQIKISGTIDTDSPILYTDDRLINSNSMQVEEDIETVHKTVSYGNSTINIEATPEGKILSVHKDLDRSQVRDIKVLSLNEIKVVKKEKRIKVNREGTIQKTGG